MSSKKVSAILKRVDKKTAILLSLTIVVILSVVGVLKFALQKDSLSSPASQSTADVQTKPSEALKVYTDPSGFTLSYPDNLSLVNNEIKDTTTYADIQLSAKGMDGLLALKISDSKFKSIDEWIKSNKNMTSDAPKEMKLGNLKAQEIKVTDKLILGALDQGVLFTIEIPLGEKKDFWLKVYDKILAEFTFAQPSQEQANFSSETVTFEGEEPVE